MNETFTTDELIAALLAARPGGDDADPAALTVQEMVQVIGRNEVIVARRLRRLIADGKVETVRKTMKRIDGIQTTVPAYRLVKENNDDSRGADRDETAIPGMEQ